MLGYDYSGYGCSTGTPSVSSTIADVNACYQFLLQVKGKRPQDVVVYGQSVGSGPTCELGAHEKDLKGIVLHSPLMSGAHAHSSGNAVPLLDSSPKLHLNCTACLGCFLSVDMYQRSTKLCF